MLLAFETSFMKRALVLRFFPEQLCLD